MAAYPPEHVAAGLLSRIDGLGLPEHRSTPVAHVHLTLAFIGETRAAELPIVSESVSRSVSGLGPMTLTPNRLATLPARGVPRTLVCVAEASPVLVELHRRLVSRLVRRPRPRAEDRFLPHLTLARFPPGVNPGRIDAPAAVDPFVVDRVRLVRSLLKPGGAEHLPLDEFELRGA
ncbi:MAG: 2'-5' RNA ligase family protein [Phycisphaeraceae bacterium]|nr:MAG: 2'-5' RNA ligase family protein [Phycisphaeraceae bacterium]